MKDGLTLIEGKSVPMQNLVTGEIVMVDAIKKAIPQKAFWKVYMTDLLSVLGVSESRQVDVFCYICEHTNASTNLFIGTYDDIRKALGCSTQTIASIMKKLQASNPPFIKKKMNGVWIVNPNVLMKGSDNKRAILLEYYENADAEQDKIYHQRLELISKQEGSCDIQEVQPVELDEDGEEYTQTLFTADEEAEQLLLKEGYEDE